MGQVPRGLRAFNRLDGGPRNCRAEICIGAHNRPLCRTSGSSCCVEREFCWEMPMPFGKLDALASRIGIFQVLEDSCDWHQQ